MRSHYKRVTKKVRSLAYNALERDDMNDIEGASEAFDRFMKNEMPKPEIIKWAERELEYQSLQDCEEE